MDDKKVCTMLFLLSLFLALFYINEGLFHYDAVSLAQAVEKTFQTGRLQPAINGRYGSVILSAITYVPLWLAGRNADLAVRLAGIIWYAASIVFFYLFISRFFGSHLVAVYAGIIFMTAGIYLSPNTFGKEHGMALAFFFLACWLLFVAKRWLYSASAAALVFSLSIREAVLVLIPFFFYLLWLQKNSLRIKIKYCIIPAMVFFAIIYYAYFSFIVAKTVFPTQTGTAYFYFSTSLMAKAFSAIWKTTPVLTIIAALFGMFFGLQKMFRKTLFFITLLFVTFFVFANNSTFVPRYLDVTVAAISVFAGIGIAFVHKLNRHTGIVLGVVLAVWSFALIEPVLAHRHDYSGPKHFGEFVGNLTAPEDIIIAQDDASFISYYGSRTSTGIPIGNRTATELFISEIQQKLANGTDVYLTQTAFIYDPGELNQKLITSSFKVEKRFVIETEASHIADIELKKYKHVVSKLKLKQ